MRKKPKDLTNQKFGRLTAKNVIGQGKNRSYIWLCECDCGKKKEVSSHNLVSKHGTKSCGCLLHEHSVKLGKSSAKPFGIASAKSIYRAYISGCKKRNLKFELSFSEFLEMTKKNCYYCNKEPSQYLLNSKYANGGYTYNGIDRKDNKIGYTIKNCVTCCKICNYAKHDLTYKEFLNWLNNLITYRIENGLYEK